MSRTNRRKIWSLSDITPGAPLNREIEIFGGDGDRRTNGSIFTGGGEGGGVDGARRDSSKEALLGKKPETAR